MGKSPARGWYLLNLSTSGSSSGRWRAGGAIRGGSPSLPVVRLPAKSPPSSQELGNKGGPPWQFRGLTQVLSEPTASFLFF